MAIDPNEFLAELEKPIDPNQFLAELEKPEPLNVDGLSQEDFQVAVPQPFGEALELNKNLGISAVGDVGVSSRFADIPGALRQFGEETPQLLGPDEAEFISQARPEILPDVTRVAVPTQRELEVERVGAIREQPVSGLGGVRDRIAAQGRKNVEFVDNLNRKINTEFPVDPEGPKNFGEFENLVTRTILRTVTGFAGFTGGTIPSLLDPGEIAPEGSEEPIVDVFKELGEGLVQLPARAAVVVDNLVDKALGELSDGAIGSPIAGAIRQAEAGEGGPIGGALLSLFGSGTINGEQLTEKDRQRVLRDAIERSEEIVFGALILSGGPRAVRGARAKTKAQFSESVSAKQLKELKEAGPPSAEVATEFGEELTEQRAGEIFTDLTERTMRGEIGPERGAEIARQIDAGLAKRVARIEAEKPVKKVVKPKTDVELSKPAKLAEPGDQAKLEVLKVEPEVKKPIVKVEVKAPIKPPVAKPEPATAAKPVVPEKTTGLNKAEIARIREKTGLSELTPTKRKSFDESTAQAHAENIDAVQIAREVVESRRPISDVEQAAMNLRAFELETAFDASIIRRSELAKEGRLREAEIERITSERITEDLETLTEGSQFGGTELARAMVNRRRRGIEVGSGLATVKQRAEAAKGSKLSPSETKKFERQTVKIAKLEKEVKELTAKNEERLAREDALQAEKTLKAIKKVKQIGEAKAKRSERLAAERTDIKKDIEKLGFRINDITGITAEGAFQVGKLAANYFRDGVNTLEAITKKVIADVPELTPRDVHQALNTKNPRRQAKARTEASKQFGAIKREAQLLTDIAKAEEGIFDQPKERTIQPAKIRALSRLLTKLRGEAFKSGLDAKRLQKALDKIDDLQDQLSNKRRPIKERFKGRKFDPAENVTAKKTIRELRSAINAEDALADVREQLRTGDFRLPEVREPKRLTEKLQRTQTELRIARKDVRGAIESLKPLTKMQVTGEVLNTLRTAKTVGDASAVLRQGFFPGVALAIRDPKVFPSIIAKTAKATFSKFSAEQIDASIRTVDHQFIRDNAGLFLAEIGGKIRKGEETFMGNFLEKIPGVASIVRASERNFNTYLNLIRSSLFDSFLEKFPNATPAELKLWAEWVNVTSGRGTMSPALAKRLSFFLFSPRFAASRVQIPIVAFKSLKQPRVRKQIGKDLAAVAGISTTALALADLAGLEVGVDPRDSDFGKIRVGDTRIDIFAGVQQPARLLARTILKGTDRTRLTGQDLTELEKDFDPVDAFGRFAKFKLSPIITTPLELLVGRTIVGEPTTPSETAARALLPLVLGDVIEAHRAAGPSRAALVGGLTFFGVGANTFIDSRTKTIKSVRRLRAQGNTQEAERRLAVFNIANQHREISFETTTEEGKLKSEFNRTKRKVTDLLKQGKDEEAIAVWDKWNISHSPDRQLDSIEDLKDKIDVARKQRISREREARKKG